MSKSGNVDYLESNFDIALQLHKIYRYLELLALKTYLSLDFKGF